MTSPSVAVAWTVTDDMLVARYGDLQAGMIAAGSRWAWKAGDRSGLDDEATARREIELYLTTSAPPAPTPGHALPAWAAVPGDDGRPVRRHWSAAEYHADSRLSRSDLLLFEQSARLYAGQRRTKTIPAPATTAAMRFGTLVHQRILEADDFRRAVWVRPENFNGRTNAGKSEIAEIRARGLLELDMDEARRIDGCAAALLAHPEARGLVERCEREVTWTWRERVRLSDDVVELDCRARLDLYLAKDGRLGIGDLKTTDDPSPAAFARSVGTYGYHYQPPFYARPLRQLFGVEPAFRFIAVRSRPPHEVVVYRVAPEDVARADKLVDAALRRFAQAVLTDTWCSPWEAPGVRTLEFPRWVLEDRS